MVDPYATTLGGLTVALGAERFLVEDPLSNSILSLHPALRFAGEKEPRALLAVEAFSVTDDCVEVTWKKFRDVRVTTELRPLSGEGDAASDERPARFEIRARAENAGDEPIALQSLHPLFFPSAGPGACALGLEKLRTLGSSEPDGAPRLMRLHGEAIHCAGFGAWFSPVGTPSLLLAASEASERPPTFLFAGARGKALSLNVACPLAAPELAPGESAEATPLLMAMGDRDINEELLAWADRLGDASLLAALPEFHPSDEIVEPEPEPESEMPDMPEVVVPETPKEPEEEDREDETADEDFGEFPERTFRLRGCAAFLRAMRATRGFQTSGQRTYPRWASGRRRQPIGGASLRTRGVWRIDYPGEE